MAGCIDVFQHVACEDLGTFAGPLAQRGFAPRYVRLFAGDVIPADWPDARALIFLGGPMSVNDEDRYPYLAAEKAVIRTALERRQPVLGICLGSQLIASATGARVYRGVRPEIGWAPITLTDEGRRDPLLAPLAGLDAVFHWHGETFDLPAGAVRLAFNDVTPNQAFRLGSAYGLQFHVEVDAAMIEAWMREYPADLGPDAHAVAERISSATRLSAAALRAAGAKVMNAFLDSVSRARG
jgi:GMP synthase (glutamine-hydrolysing)